MRNRLIFWGSALGLGLLSFYIHGRMTATCIDGAGLLIRGNLPGRLLWAAGIAMALLLAVTARGLGGDGVYADNFPRSPFQGLLMIGAGILLATLPAAGQTAPETLSPSLLPPVLLQAGAALKAWLPWAAAGTMVLAGLCRMAGKRPWWCCAGVVCLYFIGRLISLYQSVSADPRLYEYAYQVLALVLLMLASFHRACCDAELIQRRKLVFSCFGAAFCCLTALGDVLMPRFYLAGALWALGSVCEVAVFPPDPEEEPESEADAETAKAPKEEE